MSIYHFNIENLETSNFSIMTAKELIEKLKQYPDNMEVFMDERITDFTYGLLNSVAEKEINFMEEPGGPILSRDKVIVLSEE